MSITTESRVVSVTAGAYTALLIPGFSTEPDRWLVRHDPTRHAVASYEAIGLDGRDAIEKYTSQVDEARREADQ